MTSHMIVFRAALSKDVAAPRQSSWNDRSKMPIRSLPAKMKAIKAAKQD
jgi:hypothetical protein